MPNVYPLLIDGTKQRRYNPVTDVIPGTNIVSSVNGQTGAVVLTTTHVSEGSNLYWTQGRFDAALAAKSTTNLAEGTNLYWTQTRFNTAFAGKSTTDLAEGSNLYFTDTRADARITAQKGVANGLASLDAAGKIPSSQIPALAISSISTVNSQAAQLALVAQEGDVAVRTDQNRSYIHNGGTSGTMADWTQLLTDNLVLSVNGQVGSVVLTTTNINEGTNLYWTQGRFDTAFAAKTTSNLTEGSNLY